MLTANSPVNIIDGKYKGNSGTIQKLTPQKVLVYISPDKTVMINKTNVSLAESQSPEASPGTSTATNNIKKENRDPGYAENKNIYDSLPIIEPDISNDLKSEIETEIKINSPVNIINGTYKGNYGIVEKITPQKVRVCISPDKKVLINKSSVSLAGQINNLGDYLEKSLNIGESTRSETTASQNVNSAKSNETIFSTPPSKIGNQNISKIICTTESEEKKTYFLKIWLNTEVLTIVHQSNNNIETTITHDRKIYSLVASKLDDEKTNNKFYNSNRSKLQSYYALVGHKFDGDNNFLIDLQTELEKLADFTSLPNPWYYFIFVILLLLLLLL